MRKNSVTVAMLAAIAVCGVVQNASHAQGGVVMPEHAVAPALHAVPRSAAGAPVVRTESRTVNQLNVKTEQPMPIPTIRPTATGRVVHVQEYKTYGNVTPPPAVAAPAEMSMGGFVAPRPMQAPVGGAK
jgi:hypothetical protein